MGSVYRPKYRNKHGELVESAVYWIKFYRNGIPFRESTKTKKKGEAARKLKGREGEVVEGCFYGLRAEKLSFNELAVDFINDYKMNDRKAIGRAEQSVKHLKKYFGGVRAADITTDQINAYIRRRQNKGLKNGTINREMAALKRIFNLARQATPPKATRTPHIPHLKEAPPRSGFFERGEFKALKNALPDHLKPLVTMAFFTGMRKKELLTLKWDQVDLIVGKIILEVGTTKNDEARVIYMEGELLEALRFQKAVRDTKHANYSWVFFDEKGERIGRFDKFWKSASKKAWEDSKGKIKLWDKEAERPAKLFHDFRRSAIRNMVRAGVSERVAMMISGHKTRSVFDRYNIVNEDDLKRASKKVMDHYKEEANTSDIPASRLIILQ